MKTFLTGVMCVAFCSKVFTQTPFEGIVKYIVTDAKDSVVLVLHFYFKKEKIMARVESATTGAGYTGDFLVDFSKNSIYHFNTKEKKYLADTVATDRPGNNPLFKLAGKTTNKKTILNNKCTLFTYFDTGSKDLVQNVTYNLWFADTLFYPVEEKYLLLNDLALFVNGRTISLESTITSTVFGTDVGIKSRAAVIEKKVLEDSLFNIPAGCSFAPGSYYAAGDAAAYKVEISEIKLEAEKSAPPPPPPPPPRKPGTNTSKKSLKSSASKPKQ